ncbi:MAG TPA: hypothetical protein VLF60_02170 [Candidatus Saccharimonadales bacterium]|nr:hypothetical protein [Candidatus Saccharimonadales bacterium]
MSANADQSVTSEHNSHPERAGESRETLPTFEYGDYRTLCDTETDAFRRIGILDADEYAEAMEDPRTIFCEIDGKLIPALTPLSYEQRYNAERTADMADVDEVMLLTIPLTRVREGALASEEALIGGEGLPANTAILIEEPDSLIDGDREADHLAVSEWLAAFGQLEPHEFIDPRPKEEGHETAWMGIYNLEVSSTQEIAPEKLEMSTVNAFIRSWQEYREEENLPPMPGEGSNDTYLFTAADLQTHPEIVDDLWSISQVGFGKVLGEHHPISMEVTKGFFTDHIQSENVFTAVRFVDGRPVCFGFMAPDMDHNDWLDCNSTLLGGDLDKAKQEGKQVAHFFELISKGAPGMALSTDVINLFLEVASRTRKDWHVVLESTNFSATYIPHMAEALIQALPSMDLTMPTKMVSRLDYWYLKKPAPSAAHRVLSLA